MTLAPTDEAELAEAIAGAAAPLAVTGGGTRLRPEGAPLRTTGLTGITLYEPGALTMVARAGTPLAEIEATLEAEGQILAFEPYDLAPTTGAAGGGTIGGVFATNASGARRVQAGAARDFLLGVRFVDGAGRGVSNGGRVMKNVTGYDLVKLMAGSHGTLGVLSEVSFKVLPKPEATATLALDGLDDGAAIAAMTAAMKSPYDVTGAVHLAPMGGPARTLIRIEGFAESVAYRAERLTALLAPFGDVSAPASDPWPALRRMEMFGAPQGALWRVGIRPSDAAGFVADLRKSHEVSACYDWAGGRVWVGSTAADPAHLHRALQAAAAGAERRAHATLIHSAGAIDGPRFQPEPPPIARLSAGLRAKFDPRGMLNPGLMG